MSIECKKLNTHRENLLSSFMCHKCQVLLVLISHILICIGFNSGTINIWIFQIYMSLFKYIFLMLLKICSIDLVSSLRIMLLNVEKDGAFMSLSRCISLISYRHSFSIALSELMPYSMNTNNINLSNFLESQLGCPTFCNFSHLQ